LKKNILHPSPKVAVVILNWNGVQHLREFLPSVLASAYPNLQIIVADNASTDESIAWLRQHHPAVTLLESEKNFGYAGGYNYFLKQVEADYYVLLNSDVEVTPQWIQPVIDLMEQNPTIGACQPKILSYTNKEKFEYAGASGGWIDSLAYPFSRGRVFDYIEEDMGQYNDPAPTFWASGAAFFVRAKIFHAMGGFDASFFAHQEEIEFCWRLHQKGYEVYVCPTSVVYHLGGGTLPAGSRQKVYLNFRNNLIMAVRNWTMASVLWKLPLRFMLDAISAWKALFQGNHNYWLGVFHAHISFMGWFFQHLGTVGATRQNKKIKGIYQGSIVWQYFILGKRYFSQIVKTN
jgi:GT2 family glycosyltransferase